jgi:hypothetical protein
MLKDILKNGDTIYKSKISELMDSINKQLDVWSISHHDRENLETELDELYGTYCYMQHKKLDSMEWTPDIVPRYRCDKCGKIFYVPDYVEECIGEAWGIERTEYQSVSPCCHRYYYNIDNE